ncbi:hypothetical protein HDU67_002250 [Dinochytrium kinnereticum]|nr:hypothetical protein HDU67_002250 [Dinochytrium kinnereticum]
MQAYMTSSQAHHYGSVSPSLIPARIRVANIPVVTMKPAIVIEATGDAPGTFHDMNFELPDGAIAGMQGGMMPSAAFINGMLPNLGGFMPFMNSDLVGKEEKGQGDEKKIPVKSSLVKKPGGLSKGVLGLKKDAKAAR